MRTELLLTVGIIGFVLLILNAQNPSDAVLERKAPAQWLMWFILILFDCILCGVVPILYYAFGQQ